jgi:hypothetical protein
VRRYDSSDAWRGVVVVGVPISIDSCHLVTRTVFDQKARGLVMLHAAMREATPTTGRVDRATGSSSEPRAK